MKYMSLTEAARFIPSSRSGKRLHVKTLKRWIVKGCGGVKLPAVRIGGGWFTSQEWIQEFQTLCTSSAMPNGIAIDERGRMAARKAAVGRLRKHGIKVKSLAAAVGAAEG